MERLTKTYSDGTFGVADKLPVGENSQAFKVLLINKVGAFEDTGLEPSEIPTGLELANVFAALQELKQYRDAREQGFLVRLPCKIGDIVYSNISWSGDYERAKGKPYHHRVAFIGINGEKDFFHTINIRTSRMFSFDFEDIGKTVFLTRESAETALAEMTNTAVK